MIIRSNFGIHFGGQKHLYSGKTITTVVAVLTLIFMTTMVVMAYICEPALNVQSHNQLRTKHILIFCSHFYTLNTLLQKEINENSEVNVMFTFVEI